MRAFRPESGAPSRAGPAVLLWALLPALAAADSSPAESEPLALRGATIRTLTDAGSFVGTVVVQDGKITAVGVDVEVPSGAKEIDLTGHTLVPGFIDSRSVLWLAPGAANESSSRGALDILHGVNPWQDDWREVSRQGITAVYAQPTGTLGGTGAVLRVAPAESLADLVIQAESGVQASITGANSRARYSQFQQLQRALEAVKEGKDPGSLGGNATPRPETTPQFGGRGGGRGGRGRGGGGGRTAAPSQPDHTKELLEKVIKRELPLRLEVHHGDAALWALSLAADLDIRLVLDGMSEPDRALTKLAQTQVGVVVGPVWELASIPANRTKRSPDWLANIAGATDRWVLATFGSEPRSSRFLRVQAAFAVAAGVEPDAALRAITKNAARILGVDDRLGTIAEGMQADIAVFAGDPLDPAVPARLVLSKGEVVYDRKASVQPTTELATVELPSTLPDTYAIKTRRLLRDGKLSPASMLIKDGKIAAIGDTINAPEGVPVFDLGNGVVTPGLVVAHSYLDQSSALSDDTESDASQFRAIDVADATSKAAKAMRDGGFLHIAVAPASINTSAGVMGQMRLGSANPVGSPAIASKFVLTDSARNADRFPASLGGQINMLNATFGGNPEATRLYLPAVAAQVLMEERRQNIAAVTAGKRPAIIEAETGPEIRAALELTRTHHLKAALLGPEKIEGRIDQLRANHIGIIARPVSGEDYDSYLEQLAAASREGVAIAFAGNSPQQIRTTAALALGAGMSGESALRGLTGTAAELSGMAAATARLASGGLADFVVWNGSPLNLSARPVRVIVAGKVVGPQE